MRSLVSIKIVSYCSLNQILVKNRKEPHEQLVFVPILIFKGQVGVPLTVYPWYLCILQGFLEIITHKYPRDIGLI